MQNVSPAKRLLKTNVHLVAFLLISWTLKDLLMHLLHQLSRQSANCHPVTLTAPPSQCKVWGAWRNLEQELPDHTDTAPEAAGVHGPSRLNQGDGGASLWASEGSQRTEGTSDAITAFWSDIFPGWGKELQPTLLTFTTCGEIHNSSFPKSPLQDLRKHRGSVPTSSSVHFTWDIYDKKMKNSIASRIFTYYFTLLPSHFCCLFRIVGLAFLLCGVHIDHGREALPSRAP